jgi:MFS transporter, DHA1 family, tetracycline resistance protein
MLSYQKHVALTCILLVVFLDWMGIGLVYPLFSAMLFSPTSELVSPEASDLVRGLYLGILLAMMPLVQFFSSPILGAISDIKGRKTVLSRALILGVIGYLIAVVGVYAQSIIILLISRICVGISAGSAAVVEASLADISSSDEKAKNFGLFNMACGLGFTIGPFLGGQLSESGIWFAKGYDKPFLFAAFMTIVNLVMIHYLFDETSPSKEHKVIKLSTGLKNIVKAFTHIDLRIIFLSVFIFCCGWSFYWEFAPATWIGIYRFSSQDVGMMYAWGAGFYALSCGLLIQPIVKRFRPIVILFYSLLLAGISILLLLCISSSDELWLYVPLQQYLVSMIFPTSTAMISNSSPNDMQGEILGILQSVQCAAFALSPLISGPLLGLTLQMPVIVGGSAMLLAGVILGLLLRKEIFSKSIIIS